VRGGQRLDRHTDHSFEDLLVIPDDREPEKKRFFWLRINGMKEKGVEKDSRPLLRLFPGTFCAVFCDKVDDFSVPEDIDGSIRLKS
jgi:hypothetical protein